ncbi:dynactin subunit 4 [Plasmodium gonderi]|uniref:Dynactin subunit 4 n=1 Tax=Plasmodium gonderi TaxID=77519 RepID=A0A1Y1JJ69_PLAGO|nr:dynactin subunit 4 [Plasmodium gonderi]GAW82556.1 dynactin subunit 4 [Plasmodium gonderi]
MKNKVYLLLDEKLFKLKELYFCLTCSQIKNEYNLKQEIEYYFCNGCTQIYTKSESAIYSYECLRCFKCPCCFSCLTISQKYFDKPIEKICNLEPQNNEANDSGSENQNRVTNNYMHEKSSKNVEDDLSSTPSCTFYTKNVKKSSEEKISYEGNNSLDTEDENNINEKDNKMDNSVCTFFKKGKSLFYFKCPYCLWSSINSLYNTKLDELIGNMIISERNCVFKSYFKTVLSELIRNNEQLREKKNLKKTNKNATLHKIGKFSPIHDVNDCLKSHDSIYKEISGQFLAKTGRDKDEEKEKDEEKKKKYMLICKSKIKVDNIRLKDILNAEHVKDRELSRDIFELENENVQYLDPIEFHLQKEFKVMDQHWEHNKMVENHINGENSINNGGRKNKKDSINGGPPSEETIEKLKSNAKNNLIIHSKSNISIEHIHDYPYNFYKGISKLRPLRTKLVNRKSKRCSTCKQYILKLHNTNLSSSTRLDNNAMKFIPRIYINDFKVVKRKNGVLNFILINPLDSEMNIKIIPEIEYNFLKAMNINKIISNCKSKAASFEFTLDTYDEIIDELLKGEKNDIQNVVTSEYIIIKRQNNMALVIISFYYTEQDILGTEFYPEKNKLPDVPEVGSDSNNTEVDQVRKLNFPLILECSFSDKSKKVHKLKLNLLFTNYISPRPFRHYALNDSD